MVNEKLASTATAKPPSPVKTATSTTAAAPTNLATQDKPSSRSSARVAVPTTASTSAAKGPKDRSTSRGRANRLSSNSPSPSRKRAKQEPLVAPSRTSPRTRSASAGKPAPAVALTPTTNATATSRSHSTSTAQPADQVDQLDAPGPSTGATRTIKQERQATFYRQKAATLKKSSEFVKKHLKPAVGSNLSEVKKCTNTSPNHKHSRLCGGAPAAKPKPAFTFDPKAAKAIAKKKKKSFGRNVAKKYKNIADKKRRERSAEKKRKEKNRKAREARAAKKKETAANKKEEEERARKAKEDEEEKAEQEPVRLLQTRKRRRETAQLDQVAPEMQAADRASPMSTRASGSTNSPQNRPDRPDRRQRASVQYVDMAATAIVIGANDLVARNNEINPPSSLPRSSQDRNQRNAQNRAVRNILPLATTSISNRSRMNRAQPVVVDIADQAVAAIRENREKEKSPAVKATEDEAIIYPKQQAAAAHVLKKIAAKEARLRKDDLREWDGSQQQLDMLRKRVRKEGLLRDPYTEKVEKEFATKLRRELKLRRIPVDPALFKSFYWMVRYAADDMSHHTHPTLAESSAFATKKSKTAKWTFKEVMATLRLIEIKSICEACRNPLWLPAEQLAKVTCTCPKVKTPEWTSIQINKWTLHNKKASLNKRVSFEDYVNTTLRRIYISEADKLAEKFKPLQKAQIVKELFGGDEQAFLKEYPLWATPLKDRTDWIGKETYKQQLEVYRVRCAANQCPTFIFEWTGKTRDTSGGIGMPHKWITDQATSLSPDAKAEFAKKLKLKNAKIKRCSGDCSAGHTCCTTWRTTYTIGRDGLARTWDGKFLGGVDGRKVPRQCWEYDASMQLCDETCGCNDHCPRRFIEKGPQKMVIIFKTHTHGWSVRAAEDIERSEYIGTFAGHIMTNKDLETTKQDVDMFYTITPPCGWKKGEDAKYTLTTCLESNELKYVNHSCAPNSLIIRTYRRKTGNILHGIALFARQRIPAFHEITYDYYKRTDTIPFPCLCGGYACRSTKTN